MFDISSIPIIDNHTHPGIARSIRDAMKFAITQYPIEEKHLKNMVAYRMMVAELRRYFGMLEASDEEVFCERDKRYAENPRGYIQRMMKAANIQGLVCDIDSPVSAYWTGKYRTDNELFEFTSMYEPDIKVGKIIRIEVACNKRLKEELLFDEYCDTFFKDMESGILRYHAVGIKSIIAYFTGLAVTFPSKAEASAAYQKFIKNREDKLSEKIWRDYMLNLGMVLCAEKGMPLQIHTGWGDVPYGDMRLLNPILLNDFLQENNNMKVKTILLHCGYPYIRETAILSSQLPQVYLDFSEMLPFAAHGISNVLPMLLESAPVTKVMYGTDCGSSEHFLLGSMMARRTLQELFSKWVEEHIFSEQEAYEACRNILFSNANDIYSISL